MLYSNLIVCLKTNMIQ